MVWNFTFSRRRFYVQISVNWNLKQDKQNYDTLSWDFFFLDLLFYMFIVTRCVVIFFSSKLIDMFILTRCLEISSRFVYYVHYTTLYCDVLFSTCRYIPCDRLSKDFFSFQTCTYGHCDLLSCEIKPSSTFLLLSASFYLSVNSMKWSSIAVSKWYNTYMYLPHVTLLV